MTQDTSRFQFTTDLTICRILNGMWQVSGAHGHIDPARAVEEMFAYHDAGFTTWDLADHYGPAEDFIGAFRCRFATERGADRLAGIQAFTKWVPRPGRVSRRTVEDAIGVSLTSAYQLVPEASTSAVIVHHPQALYYMVKE